MATTIPPTLLVEKGADPNITDTTGMAALYAAVDMNTLGEVYGHPARPNSSKVTALDLMQVLLEHGANPERAAEVDHAAAGPYARRVPTGRRHHAADARGQERRCANATPAARVMAPISTRGRRTAPRH